MGQDGWVHRWQSPVTALNLANVPSSINTVERLAVWALQTLHDAANGQTVNVTQGQGQQPAASCSFGITADNVDRYILAAYIPMDFSALNDPAMKTWMAAQEITTAPANAVFFQN